MNKCYNGRGTQLYWLKCRANCLDQLREHHATSTEYSNKIGSRNWALLGGSAGFNLIVLGDSVHVLAMILSNKCFQYAVVQTTIGKAYAFRSVALEVD